MIANLKRQLEQLEQPNQPNKPDQHLLYYPYYPILLLLLLFWVWVHIFQRSRISIRDIFGKPDLFNNFSLCILALKRFHAKLGKYGNRVHVGAILERANSSQRLQKFNTVPPVCRNVDNLAWNQFDFKRFYFIKVGFILALYFHGFKGDLNSKFS